MALDYRMQAYLESNLHETAVRRMTLCPEGGASGSGAVAKKVPVSSSVTEEGTVTVREVEFFVAL